MTVRLFILKGRTLRVIYLLTATRLLIYIECMETTTGHVLAALKAQGKEVVSGKGGFWVKGEGFISLAKARKLTGIKAPERVFRGRVSAYGDWAIIAKINHIR